MYHMKLDNKYLINSAPCYRFMPESNETLESVKEEKNFNQVHIRRTDNHEPHSFTEPAIRSNYKGYVIESWWNHGMLWREYQKIIFTQTWNGSEVVEHPLETPIIEERIEDRKSVV